MEFAKYTYIGKINISVVMPPSPLRQCPCYNTLNQFLRQSSLVSTVSLEELCH